MVAVENRSSLSFWEGVCGAMGKGWHVGRPGEGEGSGGGIFQAQLTTRFSAT